MLKRIVSGLVVVAALSSLAFAGAKTGDIVEDSTVGTATKVAAGKNVKGKQKAPSVNVKDGSKTGDVTVKGKAGQVASVTGGKKAEATQNPGSVKADDK